MTNPFVFRLFITFIVGSVWIFLTLMACQRMGSKMGGFIGGLPSTALISFFFIGFTQSPQMAALATTSFPLAMGISSIFLVIFALTGKWGFATAIGISISGWFVFAAAIIWLNTQNFVFIIAVYVIILVFSYIILEKFLNIPSQSKSKKPESIWQTTIKSAFGGAIITIAVLLAKIGGPTLGGIFAAFPAMFISTLTLTYKSHGIEFSRSLTKSLMITGMFTIVIYAIGVRYFYPVLGLLAGTAVSLSISAFSAYLTYIFIQKKMT